MAGMPPLCVSVSARCKLASDVQLAFVALHLPEAGSLNSLPFAYLPESAVRARARARAVEGWRVKDGVDCS